MKQKHDPSHFLRWSIAIPITLLLYAALYIQIMDTSWIKSDIILRPALLLLAIITTGLVMNLAIRWQGNRLVRSYLQRFTPLDEIATYNESYPCSSNSLAKVPHAVLLLHGFGSSPHGFDSLYPALRGAGIPYWAPQLSGMGLSSVRLLYRTSKQDWARDALQAYDLLHTFADNVTVIGHSYGGTLATYVAMNRPVHHLILSGPEIFNSPGDVPFVEFTRTRYLSRIFEAIVPLVPKPIRRGRLSYTDMLDPDQAERTFQYLVLPIQSIRELNELQDFADLRKIRCRDLTVLWGRQDEVTDVPRLLAYLEKQKIAHQDHCLENSAHDVFEDFDKAEAVRLTMAVLADIVPNKDSIVRPISPAQRDV